MAASSIPPALPPSVEEAYRRKCIHLSLEAPEPYARGVVCVFDFVCALLELDAFAPVRFLDRGRERGGD